MTRRTDDEITSCIRCSHPPHAPRACPKNRPLYGEMFVEVHGLCGCEYNIKTKAQREREVSTDERS